MLKRVGVTFYTIDGNEGGPTFVGDCLETYQNTRHGYIL